MKLSRTTKSAVFLSAAVTLMGLSRAASADLIITEVDAGGSSNPNYAGDWFELTNTGSSAVDVDGYGVIDSHAGTTAVTSTLSNVTIAPGSSAVFLDSSGGGNSTIANFEAAWFGTNVPSGFTMGTYGPSTKMGLSTSGDAVNVFLPDLTTQVAGVQWASDPVGVTLDNSAGLTNTSGNFADDPMLTTESVVGVNGAFTSFDGTEVGSPGAVPEPASLSLLVLGAGGMLVRRRRRA